MPGSDRRRTLAMNRFLTERIALTELPERLRRSRYWFAWAGFKQISCAMAGRLGGNLLCPIQALALSHKP
jgi:hypothetical protein